MSKKWKIIWVLLLGVVVLTGALSFSFARVRGKFRRPNPVVQQRIPTSQGRRPNLSLQPEAFRLARRVGRRFTNPQRETSILSGTLVTGGERVPLQIIRRPSQLGEQVAIAINGGSPSLTWSYEARGRASVSAASETERKLLERFALDSVDDFVLAQLRGASYYTVDRNVRPPEARDSEDYRGPVWDIVRVDEVVLPDQTESSNYRLFYLNTVTGFIDKIVSENAGERVEASFFDWKELNGETVPLGIVWKSDDKTVMEFRLTNFAHEPRS